MSKWWTSTTACMMRCRNEGQWIRRSLERTFEVVDTIIIFDDGSTDTQREECFAALGHERNESVSGSVDIVDSERGTLHYIHSPFRPAVRTREEVNEIRDKTLLHFYCKARIQFEHMLCLDGDEILSLEALRNFGEAMQYLETGSADLMTIPFIYLWDSMTMRRVDGIYGDLVDGYPRLRFPRLFSIKRMSEADLFDSHFSWQGTQGGFHCGSIPREHLRRSDGSPFQGGFYPLSVVHYGYIEDGLRQEKVAFYRNIDPNNQFEGNYNHCLGEPDQHAPGPVKLVPWNDA